MATVLKAGEVWRCEVCGNVVKVLAAGGGQLMCCGGPMVRINDKSSVTEWRGGKNE